MSLSNVTISPVEEEPKLAMTTAAVPEPDAEADSLPDMDALDAGTEGEDKAAVEETDAAKAPADAENTVPEEPADAPDAESEEAPAEENKDEQHRKWTDREDGLSSRNP